MCESLQIPVSITFSQCIYFHSRLSFSAKTNYQRKFLLSPWVAGISSHSNLLLHYVVLIVLRIHYRKCSSPAPAPAPASASASAPALFSSFLSFFPVVESSPACPYHNDFAAYDKLPEIDNKFPGHTLCRLHKDIKSPFTNQLHIRKIGSSVC